MSEIKPSYCQIEIKAPGGCADNIYEVIKQVLENYGYIVNPVEKGCSTSCDTDPGFLSRHENCKDIPMVLGDPVLGDLNTIDLIINEQPWGG